MTKPERMSKPEAQRRLDCRSWRVSDFGIRISFGFRHSDLGFHVARPAGLTLLGRPVRDDLVAAWRSRRTEVIGQSGGVAAGISVEVLVAPRVQRDAIG